MAAYAVIARIERADPHLAGWVGRERADAFDRTVLEALQSAPAPELVDRPHAPGLAERWSDCREAWAQLTFYLLHAEGWR